jgi:site-specific DNA-adenine methylase
MPRIPYPGGKARLAKQIISFLPREGRTYLEPFAGRGNLFWAAVELGLKYKSWWLNDLATSRFFDAIRSHGHTIKVPPRSRAEFEKQRDAFKRNDPDAILLAPHLAYSGGLYESGVKGGKGCGDDDGGVSSTGFEKTLRECHRILHRTQAKITGLDWAKLPLNTLGENDVVVIDPPYPHADVKAYSDATVDPSVPTSLRQV